MSRGILDDSKWHSCKSVSSVPSSTVGVVGFAVSVPAGWRDTPVRGYDPASTGCAMAIAVQAAATPRALCSRRSGQQHPHGFAAPATAGDQLAAAAWRPAVCRDRGRGCSCSRKRHGRAGCSMHACKTAAASLTKSVISTAASSA